VCGSDSIFHYHLIQTTHAWYHHFHCSHWGYLKVHRKKKLPQSIYNGTGGFVHGWKLEGKYIFQGCEGQSGESKPSGKYGKSGQRIESKSQTLDDAKI